MERHPMFGWEKHYLKKYPGGKVSWGTNHFEVTCADGHRRVRVEQDGHGLWSDASEKYDCIDCHVHPDPKGEGRLDKRIFNIWTKKVQVDDRDRPGVKKWVHEHEALAIEVGEEKVRQAVAASANHDEVQENFKKLREEKKLTDEKKRSEEGIKDTFSELMKSNEKDLIPA